ncbi:hypothetical protein [Micromonospora globbae]|uniref:hypothetical protein n=1 Tax=Micromonospora globbae TaxID=1894969 RepID=UPI00378B2692
MTTPTGGSSPDDYWRRPPDGGDGLPDRSASPPTTPGTPPGGYAGPPPNVPPPTGWRPPVHVQPGPPRHLPPQDMAALDAAEQRAGRLTYSIGAVAGVVLVIVVCLLCSRILF